VRILVVAVAILGALSACTVSQKNFPHAAASAGCSREQQCNKGSFQNNYTSMSDCVQTNENNWQNLMNAFGGLCNYDNKNAGSCMVSIRTVSCADYQQGNFDSSCNLSSLCDGQGN
jgi:hypothetical protein